MPPLRSINEAARLIRTGQLTPRQLVDECLAAIHKYDERLHAWVIVDGENAQHTADLLGREIQAGNYRGPLHGIPVGIKDIIDVAGMPTKGGSRLREDQP